MDKNERFYGLHFDFHADHDTEIGVRTNSEDIQWYIDQAKPDYIQCDCKGHDGIASYPTKVGYPAKGLKSDNLRMWVDTVKKNGLPIYVHYSGVLDNEYIMHHPEEAARDKDGEIDRIGTRAATSLFGKYCDNLLIPQIKELIEEYDIDGVWIDGDCWAVHCDYSDNAKPYLKDGTTETKHKKIMHDAFIGYMRKYTDELHSAKPDFKICSNWAYTSYMPDNIEVNVDFLSGDYNALESVYAGRQESRFITYYDKPWDLMSWTFTMAPMAEKSAVQMCQEASVVLSLGGGFQLYIPQNRDGSALKSSSKRIKEVSEYVRKRFVNYDKKPIAQVAVYYSAETRYITGQIFNANGATEGMLGMIHGILDAQYTVDVLPEFTISEIDKYEAVIIPEWNKISDEKKNIIVEYAKSGGNVIFVGAELCAQMAYLVNDSFECKDVNDISKRMSIMDRNGCFTWIQGNVADVKTGKKQLYLNNDIRDESGVPAYRVESIGDGTIAYIPFDLGSYYYRHRSYILRNFIEEVMADIIEVPWVQVNKRLIDITVQEDDDGILINLINMNQGRHHDFNFVYDEIPSIADVEVIVNKMYKNIQMPLGEDFDYKYTQNGIKINLKNLDIHSIIKLSN